MNITTSGSMSERKEQSSPLAAGVRQSDDDDFRLHHHQRPVADFFSLRRQKYIKCCGCFVAVILILLVILLTLAVTLFRIKDPTVRLTSLELEGGPDSHGVNFTLVENVSVKNPNVGRLKVEGTKSRASVYLNGSAVGEGRIGEGEVMGGKTVKARVEVKVVGAGREEMEMVMRTCTRIVGEVKIWRMERRSVRAEVNCTVTVNAATRVVKIQFCT